MPRKSDRLTWEKAKKRWRKIYKGHVVTFKTCESPYDKEGEERAWQMFLQKKAEIYAADCKAHNDKPNAAIYRSAFEAHARLIGYLQANVGHPDEALSMGWTPKGYQRPKGRPFYVPEYAELLDWYAAQLERLQSQFETANPPDLTTDQIHPTYDWGETGHVAWEARLREWDRQKSKAAAKPLESLQGNVDRYLDALRGRGKIGEISASYCHRVQTDLATFVAFIGPTARVADKINAAAISGFKADLMSKIQAKQIVSDTAKTYCRSVRTFLDWLWQEEVLDSMPRNIKTLTIAEQIKEIRIVTPDEIATFLAYGNDRTRLFVLLMLNCGMYPSDIADLRQGEVDWKAGKIKRKRTKVKKMSSPPIVQYKLWPETWRLLKLLAQSNHKEPNALVILNTKGEPLQIIGYQEDGRRKRTCAVVASFKRLNVKLAKRGVKIKKSVKLFRKTGASMIEQHPEHARFSNYYLAKSAKTDAEKRYAIPSREQFDTALAWLETRVLSGNPAKLKARKKPKVS